MALEIAYRALFRHVGRPVLWVLRALSRQSFELAFRDIGFRLRVSGISEGNAGIKQLVKDALSSGGEGHWVMIMDNAEDTGVLADGTTVDAVSSTVSTV